MSSFPPLQALGLQPQVDIGKLKPLKLQVWGSGWNGCTGQHPGLGGPLNHGRMTGRGWGAGRPVGERVQVGQPYLIQPRLGSRAINLLYNPGCPERESGSTLA